MNSEVIVNIEDIKKAVYFISNLTQMQGNRPMQGALNSKGDYMGGIFDRWINIIPEGVVFNKIILPKIADKKDVEVITDYYDYNPKQVGIAPDVIGISVNRKAIPFVKFNERWTPVNGKPQIEVKTFKRSQKMLSLRNQNYDDKYLVLAETNFRVDYLVPLINVEIYSDDIYNELYMNDSIFINSNERGMIAQPRKVDIERDDIGTIRLLGITTAKEFIENSIKCENGESIEYFNGVKSRKTNIKGYVGKLKEFCIKRENGLFRFNEKWYDELERRKNKKIKTIKTIDFYTSDIEAIDILNICKSSISIRASRDCKWENEDIKAGIIYNVSINELSRGAGGEEYFLLKTSLPRLKSKENKLLNELKAIIDNN